MDLQNFIYLLIALVWLSGLIWASESLGLQGIVEVYVKEANE